MSGSLSLRSFAKIARRKGQGTFACDLRFAYEHTLTPALSRREREQWK